MYKIEPMQPSDWAKVQAIYQEGLDSGTAAFLTEAPEWEAWNETHISTCRLVAKGKDGVLGWSALSASSSN